MIRQLLLLLFFFCVNNVGIYSQWTSYTRGKVTDSKTFEPLSYATIQLKNSHIGIFTNAEGDFRILNIPDFESDSLIITCIGYCRLSMAFSDLKRSEINILKLTPALYGLNEVKVIARKRNLNSEAIISRALRNILKNYPIKPFSYVSYYRDYQKDSTQYLNLNEAIIQILDTGFSNNSILDKLRLIDFKKNMDFPRINITPYYDLPGTDHSNKSFKRIPYAIVGDQYGNELFILLVHDAIRNFNKRSFSFVDTLTQNFIRNHVFSNPIGTYQGNTLLYKIDFTAKRQITSNMIQLKGAIFIQPDDYSIHRLEYSAFSTGSEGKDNEIFNIETEYGREPAVDSMMCLKYISFNNSFIIPDESDTNYFKIEKVEWRQAGGPYAAYPFLDMTIRASFNRKIDPLSGGIMENYDLTIGKRKAKITRIKVDGSYSYITVRDDKFKSKELDSCNLICINLKDIKGDIIDNRRNLHLRQYRELFVQEYNRPLKVQDTCIIHSRPLEQNCISCIPQSGRFWMNTPLKTQEKLQDSQIR